MGKSKNPQFFHTKVSMCPVSVNPRIIDPSLEFIPKISFAHCEFSRCYPIFVLREMDVFEEARKKKEAERKEKEKIEEERKEYAKWQVT